MRECAAAYLISGYRVQEGRYTLIEEVKKHREIDDDGTSESFDIVLLENMEYFTSNRDGRIGAQGRRFVINNNYERLLARWHQVFSALTKSGSLCAVRMCEVSGNAANDSQTPN